MLRESVGNDPDHNRADRPTESTMSTITLTFPLTMTVRCAKINRDVQVTLSQAVAEHWLKYGSKQDLNDGHASIKRDQYGTEREWLAAVEAHASKWQAQRNAGIVPGGAGLNVTADEWAMILKLRADKAKKSA